MVVEAFPRQERPHRFVLASTPEHRPDAGPTLHDDGQWHTIRLDVRQARETDPELQYLARFQFQTDWREDRGQEFWFDNFAVLPPEGLPQPAP